MDVNSAGDIFPPRMVWSLRSRGDMYGVVHSEGGGQLSLWLRGGLPARSLWVSVLRFLSWRLVTSAAEGRDGGAGIRGGQGAKILLQNTPNQKDLSSLLSRRIVDSIKSTNELQKTGPNKQV